MQLKPFFLYKRTFKNLFWCRPSKCNPSMIIKGWTLVYSFFIINLLTAFNCFKSFKRLLDKADQNCRVHLEL